MKNIFGPMTSMADLASSLFKAANFSVHMNCLQIQISSNSKHYKDPIY